MNLKHHIYEIIKCMKNFKFLRYLVGGFLDVCSITPVSIKRIDQLEAEYQ